MCALCLSVTAARRLRGPVRGVLPLKLWTVSEWRCWWRVFGVLLQGLGALIVRVDAADILHKLFWGGGAVSLATSSADFHVLKCRPADKLEDGTVNFLDIISLKVCVGPSWHVQAQLCLLAGLSCHACAGRAMSCGAVKHMRCVSFTCLALARHTLAWARKAIILTCVCAPAPLLLCACVVAARLWHD